MSAKISQYLFKWQVSVKKSSEKKVKINFNLLKI